MTLDQQTADMKARILAWIDTEKLYVIDGWPRYKAGFCEGLAKHLVNNRPSSFVYAQLLEAAKEVQDVGRELWGNADIEQALDSLDGAIANADKVAS